LLIADPLHSVITNPDEPNVYQIQFTIDARGEYIAPPPPEEPEIAAEEIALTSDAPARVNQPVAIVNYEEGSDAELTRPEPSISGLAMDDEGNLGMKFSSEMDWPDNWVSQAETDGRILRNRRLGADMPLIQVGIEKEGVFQSLGPDAVLIASLEPDNIKFKINFENPEILGLGSQFSPDQLVVKFPETLVLNDKSGNSLVLKNA